jgi:hypothetical protein
MQFCRQICHHHKKRAAKLDKLDKLEVLEVLEALKRGPEDLGTYGQSDKVLQSVSPIVLTSPIAANTSDRSFATMRFTF